MARQTAKEFIEKKLGDLYDPAAVSAGKVYKGWVVDGNRQQYGWAFEPFNGQPLFLGTEFHQALRTIEALKDASA